MFEIKLITLSQTRKRQQERMSIIMVNNTKFHLLKIKTNQPLILTKFQKKKQRGQLDDTLDDYDNDKDAKVVPSSMMYAPTRQSPQNKTSTIDIEQPL